jgi:glutamyl-tRNA reductase
MQQTAVLGNFRAYSLSIATHPLSDLSDFPDSRAFYTAMGQRTLPAPLCSLLYMATCNRIEVYAEFHEGSTEAERDAALAGFSAVFANMLARNPRVLTGAAVLEHLIAVASGLKSLALGETQIAGQLKRDIVYAEKAGWVSGSMATLTRKALETQKKIRTTTGISENSYSLMSLVEAQIEDRGLTAIGEGVILVGASEMSAKVARFALRRGTKRFMLVRRELQRSMNAEMRALIDADPQKFVEITLADLRQNPPAFGASALILASSASEPVITVDDVVGLEERQTLLPEAPLVDLSLPANLDAQTAERFGRRAISLKTLQEISEVARSERAASARAAEPIIRRAVYQLWLDLLYRENADVVQSYLETKTTQTETEWQRLANEAALNEKQKRIMYDFLKKEQRRALASHREMILDLITGGAERPNI